MTSFRKLIRHLRANSRAAAITEFALATPLVLSVGLAGLETGNLAITHMRVNQAASHIADNASRIGDTSTLTNRKIYEADINDLLLGSNIQAGEEIELYEFGRVTISSLQTEPGTGGTQQYIAWQRCKGRAQIDSQYGSQGTGLGDPSFVGMGPPGQEVFAMEGDPVMFVEVSYLYQPIITDAMISDRIIRSTAAFQVRASRDLSEIYQRDPNDPDEIARCDIYDAYKETPSKPRGKGGWDWLFSDDPNVGNGNGNGGNNNGGSGNNNGSSGNNNGSSGNGGTSTTTSGGGGGTTTTTSGGTSTTSGGSGGSGQPEPKFDPTLCTYFPNLPWC